MAELYRLAIETTCNTGDKELIANLKHAKASGPRIDWPVSGQTDRQLVICGSGPSLLQYTALLPRNVDVLALNGAYNVLLDAGRVPDYFAMLDARDCNMNFVERLQFPTRALLATQCHPSIRDAVEAKLGDGNLAFHLNTPTTRRAFPDQRLYIGGGGTIGLTAIALGALLGYRRILLLGYDSSYSADGKSHAAHQPQNDGQMTLDVYVEDRKYLSTPMMAQQVMDFFPWNENLRKVWPDIEIDVSGDGLFYDYVCTNNGKAPTRESEAAKYATMYLESDYGMPSHRKAAIKDLLHHYRDKSLLDVGTGRGETMELARGACYEHVRGTETVPALLNDQVIHALLPNLPFADGEFDTVTNFEVIEHLLPADVVPALLELARVARTRVILSAATRSDMRSGVELHPSFKSEEELDALFASLWGDKVKKVGNLSSCGLSPVYVYTK